MGHLQADIDHGAGCVRFGQAACVARHAVQSFRLHQNLGQACGQIGCASRYAGRYVVTLSVDQVIFREPIHVGELVTFLASVNYTGNTSMEVGIKVVTENIRERSVRHTNSCFFTMVAVDDQRKPAAVPPLQPHNSEDKRRFVQAQQRRQIRRVEHQQQHAQRARHQQRRAQCNLLHQRQRPHALHHPAPRAP